MPSYNVLGGLIDLNGGNLKLDLQVSEIIAPPPPLPLPGVFNVKDFGAKGDGTSLDTASIRQAITAAELYIAARQEPAAIYLPAGVYAVSPDAVTTDLWRPIFQTWTKGRIIFKGDGPALTKIKCYMPGLKDPATNWFTDFPQFPVSRFSFMRMKTTTATGAIGTVRFEGLSVIGGTAYTGNHGWPDKVTGNGWDQTHKFIILDGSQPIERIEIQGCILRDWRGEIVYCGGSAVKRITMKDTWVAGSNGSSVSCSTDFLAENCTIGGTAFEDHVFQPVENFAGWAGQGNLWKDCLIYCGPNEAGKRSTAMSLHGVAGTTTTVDGCTIHYAKDGILLVNPTHNFTVKGTRFVGCGNGVVVPGGSVIGYPGMVFENNTFDSTGALFDNNGVTYIPYVSTGNTFLRGVEYTGPAKPVDPPPPPPPDTTAPVSLLSGFHDDNSAMFSFTASEPNCIFEGRLNSGAWEAVTSPKAYADLAPGQYVFEVRAIDLAGNVEATPARFAWSVAEPPPVPSLLNRIEPPFRAFVSAGPASAYVTLWRSPTKNLDGYGVYRDGVRVKTLLPDELGWEDTGLTNGQTYVYHVSALRGSVESERILCTNHPNNEGQCIPRADIAPLSKAVEAFGMWHDLREESDGTQRVYRRACTYYGNGGPPLNEQVEKDLVTGADIGFYVPSVYDEQLGRNVANFIKHGFVKITGYQTMEVGDDSHLTVMFGGKKLAQNSGTIFGRMFGATRGYLFRTDSAGVVALDYREFGDTTDRLLKITSNGYIKDQYTLFVMEWNQTTKIVTIKTVKPNGEIVQKSAPFTHGPLLHQGGARLGVLTDINRPFYGHGCFFGQSRRLHSDDELLTIVNGGKFWNRDTMRVHPPRDPGYASPGVPRNHGIISKGSDFPVRPWGQYFYNFLRLDHANPQHAEEMGSRYMAVESSDHADNRGTNEAGVWVSFPSDPGVREYTKRYKIIPFSAPASLTGAPYQLIQSETPYPVYVREWPRPYGVYVHSNGPTFGLRTGTAVQSTHLFTATHPKGPYKWEACAVPPVACNIPFIGNGVDSGYSHTGYQVVFPPGVLPGTDRWQAYGVCKDGLKPNGRLTNSADGKLFELNKDDYSQLIDWAMPFPYDHAEADWHMGAFVHEGRVWFIGSVCWLDPAHYSNVSGTGMIDLKFDPVRKEWRVPTGNVWNLFPGWEQFPLLGYQQSSSCFADYDQGLVHVFPKHGYAKELNVANGYPCDGYDELWHLTMVIDEELASKARPVGVRIKDGVLKVKDALPHRNYKVYRQVGSAWDLVGPMPASLEMAVEEGFYRVNTVHASGETEGAVV